MIDPNISPSGADPRDYATAAENIWDVAAEMRADAQHVDDPFLAAVADLIDLIGGTYAGLPPAIRDRALDVIGNYATFTTAPTGPVGGAEHYRRAEELMQVAAQHTDGRRYDAAMVVTARAQVHAQLAQAAATALHPGTAAASAANWQAWFLAAGPRRAVKAVAS